MSFVPVTVLTGKSSCPSSPRDSAPNSSGKPRLFYKTFAARDQYYLYDANTGLIVDIDKTCFEFLEALQMRLTSGEEVDLESVSADGFSEEEHAHVRRSLRAMQGYGILRPVALQSRMRPATVVRQKVHEMIGLLGQLTLSVAEQCNLRCTYCAYSGGYANIRVHNNTNMTWSVAQKAIDYFLTHLAFEKAEVTFYGGEPLINFSLIAQCVDYVARVNPNVGFGMTTNGTFLTDNIVEFLVKHNVRLTVSLDGPEEIHDRDRRDLGDRGTFNKIVGMLRRLKTEYPEYYHEKVSYNCTLRPSNEELRIMEFFLENNDLFGHGKVRFGKLAEGHESYSAVRMDGPSGFGLLESRYLDKVEKRETGTREFSFLQELFERSYATLHKRRIAPQGYGEHVHSMGACFPGHFRLFVRADGLFQICEKSNNALIIGSVESGWDVEKIVDIYSKYSELHNNECRSCWVYRFCPSCYVSSTQGTGRFEAALNPAYCDRQRSGWERRLVNYVGVLKEDPHAFDYLDDAEMFDTPIPILDEFEATPGVRSR